jgi:hypothetical protein
MTKRHCPKHRQLAFVSKENEETTKCQRAKIQGANLRQDEGFMKKWLRANARNTCGQL